MQALLNFVTSPWVGILVLAVLVLEGIGLAAYRASTGNGPALSALLPFFGAGAAFALALTAALSLHSTTADATVSQAALLGLPLLAALVFHLWDLKRRWND